MKFKQIIPILLIVGTFGTTGCIDRSAKQRAIERREKWVASLADSLVATRLEIDSTRKSLATLRDRANGLLEKFRTVENPKEVEKYYLPSVAGFSYPLTSTGLAARLTASEQLELVAAYAGAPFDAIRIESPGKGAAQTPSVPHDQALNYRNGNMTTVAFGGKQIDSLAYMLSEISSPVIVVYTEKGRQVGTTTLSAPQTEALRLAAELASTRRSTLLAEKRLQILSRKMQILENETP